MELTTQFYAADPKVGKIITWVGYYRPGPNEDSECAATNLLQSVADKNPDRTARRQAIIALARLAKRNFSEAEYKKNI